MKKSSKPLSPPDKRTAPLTSDQHEEIAQLLKSSMDSTAKNPKPALTREGRMVVRREVTTLARAAGVRRLQSHSTTFRRALVEFEKKIAADKLPLADQREGRLAIEHLWRWLHGYVKPIEPRNRDFYQPTNPAARPGEGSSKDKAQAFANRVKEATKCLPKINPEACDEVIQFLYKLEELGTFSSIYSERPSATAVLFSGLIAQLAGLLDKATGEDWREHLQHDMCFAVNYSEDQLENPQLSKSTNLIDFRSWKQSHARPIKRCAVEVSQ